MMKKLMLIKVVDFNFDLFLGIALVKLAKYNEAIKMYDQALNINPNDENAYVNKGIRFILNF